MTRISGRKRRRAQKGVEAIFSDRNHRGGRRFALYDFEDGMYQDGHSDPVSLDSPNLSEKRSDDSRYPVSRVLLVVVLAGIMLMVPVGFSELNRGLQHHNDLGTSGTGTSPPVKTSSFRTITPSFNSISNLAENTVSANGSYTEVIVTSPDDFMVVQIAYSQGTGGNLPDIATVTDSQSTAFARMASASPGVGDNFWEQVWTGRASATGSTSITVSPDWVACERPCVGSIIIAMTVGRYQGVAGVGYSTSTAPNSSSTFQLVTVATTQANSTFVELLSHGAYSSCGIDAPQPGAGQTSRNCFTATTERTEFFDHSVSVVQTYTESFSWSQVEVQRGIYLELKGNSIPNTV